MFLSIAFYLSKDFLGGHFKKIEISFKSVGAKHGTPLRGRSKFARSRAKRT
jgi:hypothetical protein